MSGYSERSQKLAEELRAKALRNLTHSRNAASGQFVTKAYAKRHPSTTIVERDSSTGNTTGKK